MSDPRPPDDGPSWPERDLDERRPEEPAEGLSDDPYRYEPPLQFRPYEPVDGETEPSVAGSRYPPEHPFAEDDPFPQPQGVEEPPPPESVEEAPAYEPEEQAEPRVAEPDSPEPTVQSTEPTMAFAEGDDGWDPKLHGNRRRPTSAEQAVPWLIGIILALTGMVIVLLALIFSSPGGLVAGEPSATPTPSGSVEASAKPTTAPSEPAVSPSAGPSASPEPTQGPSPTAQPSYGPLEMVYLGRPSGTAPIYLLRRDFSRDRDPQVLAQADGGVEKFAWSPDGRVGAAIIAERAVALTPGQKARRLADNISAISFGWDAETIYAVRITRDGSNDVAHVLQIDFVGGASQEIADIRYDRPVTAPETPLREAQFIDDGGHVRIYAVADGNLVIWILGAPSTYRVDPGDGGVREIARQPVLWSPDGTQRVTLHENGGSTTLRLRNRTGSVISAVTMTGLVSHVRWADTNNEIVFTLGVVSAGGGVRQDLYVWDLGDRSDPLPLTSNGASFGADWRGVMPNWAP